MNTWLHAQRSVNRYGGVIEDYTPIHETIDSSKSALADMRHRTLTHNTWFISLILPKIHGDFIVNSDGRKVSVRQIGEDHVLEDFKGRFIPTAADFIQEMEYKDWMQNGADVPSSHKKLKVKKSGNRKIVYKGENYGI